MPGVSCNYSEQMAHMTCLEQQCRKHRHRCIYINLVRHVRRKPETGNTHFSQLPKHEHSIHWLSALMSRSWWTVHCYTHPASTPPSEQWLKMISAQQWLDEALSIRTIMLGPLGSPLFFSSTAFRLPTRAGHHRWHIFPTKDMVWLL